MLQVTARVFDNNQLVGYQITDGSQTQLFTRQQAWIYAKNKQLLNVVATGDETNPGLSGTNGFELKRLPEIKWKEPQSVKTSQKFNFNTQDLTAALIRHLLSNGNIPSDKEECSNLCRQQLKSDVEHGIVTPSTARSLSPSIHILDWLSDEHIGTVGWRIKYTGPQPLRITRMTATPDHSTSEVLLQSGNDICLSKAELAILASRPEIDCTFSNAKLVAVSRQPRGLYEQLWSYNMMTEDIKNPVPVQRFVDNNTIKIYFTPDNSGVSEYTTGDMSAAYIRHIVKAWQPPSPDRNERTKYVKQSLEDDIASGILTKENCRTLSNSIFIESTLRERENAFHEYRNIIGYKVKNTGLQPIPITRMTATPDHSTSQVSLNPGQSMCLNRAEIALLASKPEIGCRFANGRLLSGSYKAVTLLYDYLIKFYTEYPKDGCPMDTDVHSVESPSNINTYFLPNDTAKNLQQKGLFNAFKR